MSRRLPIWMILAATLVLAACSASRATPDRPAPFFYASGNQNVVDQRVGMQQRLNAVAFPILRSAQRYCGTRTRLSHGLSVAKDNPFADVNENAYQDRSRRGNTPRLLYTVPGSPAHRAGLRGGDEILSVNGVQTKRKGSKFLFRAMREGGDAPLWLLVRRGSEKRMAKVVPVAICDTPVVLAGTPEVVSWSTRSKVKVGEGMIRFVRTDTELALVVAHELSHIVLRHTGAFFGRGSAKLEKDADYLGLYLVAKAGYEPDQALGLFPRMAAAFPGMDGLQAYPTIGRRCAALAQTIEEIARKQRAGLDLVPDEKIWRGRRRGDARGTSPDEDFADRLHRIRRYVRAQPEPGAGPTLPWQGTGAARQATGRGFTACR
jgi:hypothetical protein